MIARQLSRMRSDEQCMSQVPGTNDTVTTVFPTAIRKSDSNIWTNMLSMSEVVYLPWARDRPNILEDEYKLSCRNYRDRSLIRFSQST